MPLSPALASAFSGLSVVDDELTISTKGNSNINLWPGGTGIVSSLNDTVYVVGDANRTILGGSFVIARTLDNTFAGSSPHGFDENSTMDRDGTVNMAAFASHTRYTGEHNYGHYIAFQHASSFASSGTLDQLYTLASFPTVSDGHVNTRRGIVISDVQKFGDASLGANQGIYIAGLSAGATNHAIYVEGPTQSFFGGSLVVGTDAVQTTLTVAGQLRQRTSATSQFRFGTNFPTGEGGFYATTSSTGTIFQSIQQPAGVTSLTINPLGGSIIAGADSFQLAMTVSGSVRVRQSASTQIRLGTNFSVNGDGGMYMTASASGSTIQSVLQGTGWTTLSLNPNGGTVVFGSTISTAGGSQFSITGVSAVSPTSPNRTITINYGGTTYYLAAKTTND